MQYDPEAEWISGWGIGESCANLFRIKVPHGWLVERTYTIRDSVYPALCFIPDPNHEWVIVRESEIIKDELEDYYNEF